MRNLVRRVSSRWIHQGNLVQLREDRVVLPHGSEALYEFVEIKHGSRADGPMTILVTRTD